MNAMINQKAKALYRALTSASPASAAPIAKRRRMKRFGQTLLVITAVALGLLPGSPAQAETNWLSVSGPGSTWWCTAEYKSPNHAIYARNCVIKTGFYAKPAMIVRNASGRTLTRNSDELPLYLINSTTDALIDAQFCGGVTIYSGTSKACVAVYYTYKPCTYVGTVGHFNYTLPMPGASIYPPRSPAPRTAC